MACHSEIAHLKSLTMGSLRGGFLKGFGQVLDFLVDTPGRFCHPKPSLCECKAKSQEARRKLSTLPLGVLFIVSLVCSKGQGLGSVSWIVC